MKVTYRQTEKESFEGKKASSEATKKVKPWWRWINKQDETIKKNKVRKTVKQ